MREVLIVGLIAVAVGAVGSPCDRSRVVLTSSWGVITDGPPGSNYTQDSHCEWLVKANSSEKFITLRFQSMGTECSYDYVFVYDGDSFNSPLLGSFSGKTEPQEIVATSGHMLILLYSDTNYVLEGFRAEYSVTECRGNCSGRGECLGGRCLCEGEWGSEDCSRRLCPCSPPHGSCTPSSPRTCLCSPGLSGRSCSLSDADTSGNKWHWVYSGGMPARAAHTAVYVEESDSLYVYGGYDLNYVLGDLVVFRFNTSLWEDQDGNVIDGEGEGSGGLDSDALKAVLAKVRDEEGAVLRHPNFLKHVLFSLSENKTLLLRYQGKTVHKHSVRVHREPGERAEEERPLPRYAHAASRYPGGFVVYGGKLENGSLSDELWFYSTGERRWRAVKARRPPPPLARHSLTLAHDDYLYLLGGSLSDGQFSSDVFRIKISQGSGEWEEVSARGGKGADVRVVGHTTVYQSGSLLVYAGIVASVARFSKLSDRLYAFHLGTRHWAELHYPRAHLRDSYVPGERAFHTSTVIGNYMVVFGGYTHRHNKEEICYDNQIYLYHLGCHTWVSHDILGPVDTASRYPKRQGVFAHAAALRKGNTLLLVGGYHGNVNADLLAYTLPPTLASPTPHNYDPELMCHRHRGLVECTADPECGWCPSDETCYGRTLGGNCTTNLQATRCPGLCPALAHCQACLSHPPSSEPSHPPPPIVTKLSLAQCSWCVHNARCHRINDNYGVCGLREETPSQTSGWWGDRGVEVTEPHTCRLLDKRPGLTFIKYKHPMDLAYPDYVGIINATSVDVYGSGTSRTEQALGGEVTGRLLGFLHPPPPWGEHLSVCASHSTATLLLGTPNSTALRAVSNFTADAKECRVAGGRTRPAMAEPGRYPVDFTARRTPFTGPQLAKMELHHNKSLENPKVFTFEYLEPYEGTEDCSTYRNCLACLTDARCGWCPVNNMCFSREADETQVCVRKEDWHYFVLVPYECINCSNYVSCESCIESKRCEWWAEEARCSRKRRSDSAVVEADKCPPACHKRANCSQCLDGNGRCVWCQATQECFSFAVYTSQYQFGLCREWLDQGHGLHGGGSDTGVGGGGGGRGGGSQEGCRPCSRHANCSSCLRTLGCGWCYHLDNPIMGACAPGDFSRPYLESCASEIGRGGGGGGNRSLSEEEVGWSYGSCPDVDECGLGLHDCHPQAICTNTQGAYTCVCKQGYIGDGKTKCTKTCFNKCVHGYCMGPPLYTCRCDLGWTDVDCSVNCGCHNHSTCTKGLNICDQCTHFTNGEFCQFCRAGSYGNATSEEGCHRCNCNDHGNADLGVCDSVTGVCFCQDNTEGATCDKCKKGFYGDPRRGGACYSECVGRGKVVWGETRGLGSRRAETSPWTPRRGPSDCLWVISPPPAAKQSNNTARSTSILQLTVDTDISVSCTGNSIYVYDGLPPFVTTTGSHQSHVLGVFCSQQFKYPVTVQSKSGVMTVYYKERRGEEGFNASVSVLSCPGRCGGGHVCSREGQECSCPEGTTGPHCSVTLCPHDCNSHLGHGVCDKNYGRCLCSGGRAGEDCGSAVKPWQVVSTRLFDSSRLPDPLDHLRKTIPRFGHSLLFDRRGSLWLFGGYSLSHGALNDIRLFDTKNNTWMQVTVDSTNDATMPGGRYFHSAAISQARREVFVHGGLSGNGSTLSDFWKFGLKTQRWTEIQGEGPEGVAGASLTLRRGEEGETLVLVGGFNPDLGFSDTVWEYSLSADRWTQLNTTGNRPVGVFGHSAVWHWGTESVYVYGGHVYGANTSYVSDRLYTLHYPSLTWSVLPPFTQFNPPRLNLPGGRFLHSAVSTDDYMLVFGGRGETLGPSEVLVAYSYTCNHWMKLITKDVEVVGEIEEETYGQAMTLDSEELSSSDQVVLYVMGGRATDSRVTRVSLPPDLCALWKTKDKCRSVLGCSFCSVTGLAGNSSFCYSNGRGSDPCRDQNGTLRTSNGVRCSPQWMAARGCDQFTSCTHCLARWPVSWNHNQVCKWCGNCGAGKCISGGNSSDCTKEGKCGPRAREMHSMDSCPELHCAASDCEKCTTLSHCAWTRQVLKTPEEGTTLAAEPVYDWNCVGQGINDRSSYKLRPVATCPPKCSQHTDCHSCLSSQGGEGGWHECRWSTRLGVCLSPGFQPLLCAGGVCGLVVADNATDCPVDCSAHTECHTCLQFSNCGWCHRPSNLTGQGTCTEGVSEGPTDRGECADWNYWECPEENECVNGHHDCHPEREACVDLEAGYSCACAEGYAGDACSPVCPGGCGHGVCTAPRTCHCRFGYVGQFCSSQCLCNGHSTCEGPHALDTCLDCKNNTQGGQCQRCKPLYVGDPTHNGQCVPCLDYCNGHTWICVNDSLAEFPYGVDSPKADIESFLLEGPTTRARCVGCGNKTRGDKCEECLEGHFRGCEDRRVECRPCQCHGHGHTCDPVTGDKCNCGNNTESESNCGGKGPECWSVQCSKCRESYMGTPTGGRQCYKQMSVDLKYCLDTKLIHECKLKPAPLNPGQTVFFAVQPRFMNVDIRVTVDVTQGSLNVFLSPRDDTFVVEVDSATGLHSILADPRYRTSEEGNWTGLRVESVVGRNLRTHVRLERKDCVLTVTNLTDRLVVTLPHDRHELGSTRFFVALLAVHRPAYGTISFRQDQLHIDLFVFFSVFFSCFFLFLAGCVVVWKVKQTADARQARRRHVVEMLHMAKRAFAGVWVVMGGGSGSGGGRTRPVALEPTRDGLGAVATLLVRLPGAGSAPTSLALASTLVLLARPPRAFLRRRSSH